MSSNRIKRVNELLRREIGDALFQIMNESDLDVSSITLTQVVASPNLRSARVFVSIRNHHDERDHMLALISRHRTEIQRRINRDLTLKYTPRLSFELDPSLEKGNHVLELLSEIEETRPHDEYEDEDAGGT